MHIRKNIFKYLFAGLILTLSLVIPFNIIQNNQNQASSSLVVNQSMSEGEISSQNLNGALSVDNEQVIKESTALTDNTVFNANPFYTFTIDRYLGYTTNSSAIKITCSNGDTDIIDVAGFSGSVSAEQGKTVTITLETYNSSNNYAYSFDSIATDFKTSTINLNKFTYTWTVNGNESKDLFITQYFNLKLYPYMDGSQGMYVSDYCEFDVIINGKTEVQSDLDSYSVYLSYESSYNVTMWIASNVGYKKVITDDFSSGIIEYSDNHGIYTDVIISPYLYTKYQLTLLGDDGISSVTSSGQYYATQEISISAIVDSDCIWDKWTVLATYPSVFTANQISQTIKMPYNNVTLTATTLVEEYSISYESNVENVNIPNPTTYTERTATFTLIIPTKTGYGFQGWIGTDTTESPQYDVTIPKGSTGDRSYLAWFYPEAYYLTYNLNEGDNSLSNPKIYRITTDTFTINNPTKEGYSFTGWSGTDLEGSNNINFEITLGSIGDKSYTANWSINTYSIFYTMNGAINSLSNPTSYTIESETITLINPNKTGCTFSGWSGDGIGTNVSITTGSIGDKTFIANWNTITYSITYSMNEAINSTSNPTSYTVESETITLINPNKTGYTFSGWSGDGIGTNVSIVTGSTGDKIFIANWNINTYSIFYVMNGAINSLSNPTSYTVESLTITLINPNKIGYTFSGWSGDGIGTNVSIVTGSTGDKTFIANWDENIIIFNDGAFNNATYRKAYVSNPFTPASNGSGNYSYSIISNTLSSITLNENRTISGTPIDEIGNYLIVIEAIDNDTLVTKNATFTLMVVPNSNGTVLATLPTSLSYNGTEQTIQASLVEVEGEATTEYGYNGNQHTNAGKYQTTIIILGGNWTGSQGTFDWEIVENEVTINANNISKIYGEIEPIFTYSYTGNIAPTDSFTGTLSREIGENVGNYDITLGSLELNENYTITFNSATLNINPKNLTISGVDAEDRICNGSNEVSLIGGELVGVIPEDIIGFTLGNGTAIQTNSGTNISVLTDITLTGDNKDNYSLSQPIINVDLYREQVLFDVNSGITTDKTETYFEYDTNEFYDTINDGSIVSIPAVTRDGYTFIGWYDKAVDGAQVINSTNNFISEFINTEDATLYANWTKNSDEGTVTEPTDPDTGDEGTVTDPTDPDTGDEGTVTEPTDPDTGDEGTVTDPTDPDTGNETIDTDNAFNYSTASFLEILMHILKLILRVLTFGLVNLK